MSATARHERRQVRREATTRDILDAARALLRDGGPAAVSLRGVAREVGLTPPALYRYHASLDDLLTALIADCYDAAAEALEQARDSVPADEPGARLHAVVRAFRRWALEHRQEFGLVFGSPLPGYAAPAEGPTEVAGARFGAVFIDLFAALWRQQPFPIADVRRLDRGLVRQLHDYRDALGLDMPLGALYVLLRGWSRIYGLVSLEAFDQLDFCLTDVAPFFEAELSAISADFGLAESG